MRILALIHRLPCPLDRGAKLRSAAELNWLTARHEVWCAGFLDPLGPGESARDRDASLARLRQRCRALAAVPLYRPLAWAKALLSVAAGRTATEGYFHSRALARQVHRWSQEVRFDAVLAYSSAMAPLALSVPAKRRVLDLVDLDSRKWADSVEQAGRPARWVYAIEGRRLATREERWIEAFDAAVFCAPREVDLLRDERLRRRVQVIETGAASMVDPDTPDNGHGLEPLPLPEAPVVGFLGAMDYPPNVDAVVWFAREIWPRIRQEVPGARFLIIGRSPTRAVRELGDLENIEVTGMVPEVEPWLARLKVSVAPLRLARGLQSKVLMAMAKARPCVVTSCVSEGLGTQAGRDLLVADETDAFAEAVLTLLRDHQAAVRLGRAGLEFVRRRYNPAAELERLEKLLVGDEGVSQPHTPVGSMSPGWLDRTGPGRCRETQSAEDRTGEELTGVC